MGSAYKEIISSELFTFVTGPNSKEYKVHGNAISRLSKPLGVLLNGNMCEANEKCELISKFLDKSHTMYPTSGFVFAPRKNTKGCEDYTGVFLCHAKLYVMADIYDIPSLQQLSLHRLHATLKEFTLYPSRMNNIATLAKYVFENTVPQDKICHMVTLYYACIVEDAKKQAGLSHSFKMSLSLRLT
ncbi:hypothetical protein DHEL01_v211746 [Diaporthe helianthi]|uniref:BTB domain-containing protein n=1 Tax=Diaporthe helianthi TaxID=158607 RepID=A0A2P5HHX5_DIAHE|nr:hypothetical protein DHEL01_v211746 [Diaporthe helianthi]